MAVQRWLSVERLTETVERGLEGGKGRLLFVPENDATRAAGLPRRVFEYYCEHDCTDPVPYELHARYSAQHTKRVPPLMIRGTARCRKCERCMKMRQWLWQQKAINEFRRWPITLFGTVTMAPEEHVLLDGRIMTGTRAADGQWIRHPKNIATLSPEELFTARVSEFGTELQRYVKRLRKGRAGYEKPEIRYLLVAEGHDSDRTAVEMRGRPHFHLLIHEMKPGRLVRGSPLDAFTQGESGEYVRKKYKSGGTWREGVFLADEAWMRLQWPYGHTKFQFAQNERAASYLCKYLSKTLDTRVRASQAYGLLDRDSKQNPPNGVTERSEENGARGANGETLTPPGNSKGENKRSGLNEANERSET